MSADQPSLAGAAGVPRRRSLGRLKWALWLGALAVGIGAGAGIALLSRSDSRTISNGASAAVQTWPAGVRRAPAFTLRDQNGKPLTLAAFHGRPVIVTFIDPLCRDFCPREASVLSAAAEQLGSPKPAIVSVSVDPWADTAGNFSQDAVHWRLTPGWRWGIGARPKLAAVWKSYGVGVLVTKKTIAGVTVRYITHTGAAYLIDASGYERALFLYPFETGDVVKAARSMISG